MAILVTLLNKLPFNQNGKVAFGTLLCIGICSYPMLTKSASYSA